MAERRWHAEVAWLGETVEKVLISVDRGRITALETGLECPDDAWRLPGFTIPALANVHSHAFHRALRGRTHGATGDFWSWRELMYELAGSLDPDGYFRLARATYAEMALAGVAAVGEFHYLHHDTDGQPYANPNAMGDALITAAREAGVRLTLIDTCYLRGGMGGEPLAPVQRRFTDGSVKAWAERVATLTETEGLKIGAAIHSVRAVDPESIRGVADWARERDAPLHVHVSEQELENEMCLAATGRTPTGLLDYCGAVGPGSTAIHATHLTDDDVAMLGTAGSHVCLCPTTERDLGDGVGAARPLADAGARITVGSDMHAVIDLFEEARAVELDQRLLTGRRCLHAPESLLDAVTIEGMGALGWHTTGLAVGQRADFTTVGFASPRTAGSNRDDLVARVIFTATAADVTHLVVAGEPVVEDGRHVHLGDVGAELAASIEAIID